MVTVREQLPGRLNELSQETTVEHAEQAHQDLTEWLDRFGFQYRKLKQAGA
jgi:GTP pyrophosphokinase